MAVSALGFALVALAVWAYETHADGLRDDGFKQGASSVQTQWDADRLQRAEQDATQTAALAVITKARQDAATKAANEAKDRERALRAAAAAALAESERLSGELEATRTALATAPVEAVRLYAATATAVLNECQRAYLGMAQEADGHASDSLMYQQAWPQ